MTPHPVLAPYDGVLLLSFGGPESPPDVVPFLQNVTRGRGVPPQRLEVVAEHYLRFGGRSPINDQNRALIVALRAELDRRTPGLPSASAVPIYWGNRNWQPYLADALGQARDAGSGRLLVLVTSAYASYSGCRQYREDLAEALAQLDPAAGPPPRLDKVRHYFNHPGFVEPTVDAVASGLAALPEPARADLDRVRLLFVTHSVPTAMNDTAGSPAAGGGAYLRQHQDVADTVVAAVRARLGPSAPGGDLVFCSRSGPPHQPWLEPDINDHLVTLHAAGVTGVVVVPIGFVSDHLEVAYDLDTEAAATADRLGLPFVRVPTVGTDPRFVAGVVDLLAERAAAERGADPPRPAVGRLGPSHDVCPAGCCRNLRGDRPAACGLDQVGR